MRQIPACIAPSLDDLIRLEGRAKGFSFGAHRPVRSVIAGRKPSRIRGRGLSFEELRGYQPGDDVRMMDWRATARIGRPQLRVYTEERDRPVILVVDMTGAMFAGTQRATKSATASELSALIAWRALAAGDRVGAVVFGDDGADLLRPASSRPAVVRVLACVAKHAIALVDAVPRAAGPGPLKAALRHTEALRTHGALIVVIHDLFAADPETTVIAGRLAQANDVIMMPVSDALERALPPAPWSALATDGAVMGVLDSASHAMRRTLAAEFARRMQIIGGGGLPHGLPIVAIATERDPQSQLRSASRLQTPHPTGHRT